MKRTEEEPTRKGKKKEKPKFSPFELLPQTADGYEAWEQAEYHYKMLCHIASGQLAAETKRLFEGATLFDVYEIIILNRALSWG